MTPELFVDAIRKEVRDSAVQEVLSVLERPPGRRPDVDLPALSDWFKHLPVEDQKRAQQMIELTSHHATFGFLCVLDSARAIEDPKVRGSLELYYVKGDDDCLLNDPRNDELHSLL